jgi:ribonucleoside-diphosphate reductase beta chain
MIFEEQISRKPDHYPWSQEFISAMHDGFWTNKEFNFQSDLQDFKVKLSEKEKEIIVKALTTIGQLEISVKKFWSKLGDNLPHPSMSDLGFVMANTEVIHGDAYERLLEVLGLETAFDDALKLDIVKGRVNYLRKHLHKFHSDNKKQFVYSIILFTLFVENIALFSQFYIINWFGRYKNLLKDTNKQVEYTSRDDHS